MGWTCVWKNLFTSVKECPKNGKIRNDSATPAFCTFCCMDWLSSFNDNRLSFQTCWTFSIFSNRCVSDTHTRYSPLCGLREAQQKLVKISSTRQAGCLLRFCRLCWDFTFAKKTTKQRKALLRRVPINEAKVETLFVDTLSTLKFQSAIVYSEGKCQVNILLSWCVHEGDLKIGAGRCGFG